MPDIFLPIANNRYHGLFIELKRRVGGSLQPDQKDWIGQLEVQGYKAVVCKGAEEAMRVIEEYIK